MTLSDRDKGYNEGVEHVLALIARHSLGRRALIPIYIDLACQRASESLRKPAKSVAYDVERVEEPPC